MDEYLSELRNKFGYSDDLLKAIEITINLMIEEYGENEASEIYSLFAGTKVIALKEVNRETLDKLDSDMGSYNPHVIFEEEENPYGTNLVASSYNYQPIYNADMQVVREARYIVTQDMSENYNGEEYKRVFGTYINMPYFIHEANHAYAMMHPEYKYEGKKIIAKHGMYVTTHEYEEDKDGKFVMRMVDNRDIILEEVINEGITQRMLVRLLNKNDYKEVKGILNEIHHNGTEYGAVLVTLGELLEKNLGKSQVMDYRRNNNETPINYFNEQASKSDIAVEYMSGEIPYEHLSKKCHELFDLNLNKLRMTVDDYGRESATLMIDALASIEAFKNVEYNTTNLENFNKRRDTVLNNYPRPNKNL